MPHKEYDSLEEAIAGYLVDCERHCGVPYKAGERLCWHDWIEANPVPTNFSINWTDTIIMNYSGTNYSAIAWKPCFSDKWMSEFIDDLKNDSEHAFHHTMDAVIFEAFEDDRASDTESTATAPDAVEAPTEPLPRD